MITFLKNIQVDIVLSFSVFKFFVLTIKYSSIKLKKMNVEVQIFHADYDLTVSRSVTQNRPRAGRWRKGFVQWRMIAGCRDVHSLMDNRDSQNTLTAHRQEKWETRLPQLVPAKAGSGTPFVCERGLVVNMWKTNYMQVTIINMTQ